jgi:hypothetical protein
MARASGAATLVRATDSGLLIGLEEPRRVGSGAYRRVAVSADGAQVAAQTGAGALELWRLADGERVGVYQGALGVTDFAFDETGRLHAVGGAPVLLTWQGVEGAPQRARLGARLVSPHLATFGGQVAVSGVLGPTAEWNVNMPLVVVRDAAGATRALLTTRWDPVTSLAFVDEDSVAVGTEHGAVRLLAVRTGRSWLQRAVHSAEVTAVAVTPEGWLMTAGRDARVQLLDPEAFATPRLQNDIVEQGQGALRDAQRVATLVSVDGDRHVIATGDGYYAASRDGLRQVGFEHYGRPFDFERFDAWMNRPDEVLHRLGQAAPDHVAVYRAAAERRRRLHGLRDAPSWESPTVELQGRPPTSTSAGSLTLDLSARAGASPLASLHVSVDSVPVLGRAGRALEGERFSGELPVALTRGANRMQVWVRDATGVDSPRLTFEVTCTQPPVPRDLYVLSIGVSDYAIDALDLALAAKDARDVADAFRATSGFGQVHVQTVLDGQATREGVLAARGFLERAGVEDVVAVFVAGHGYLDEGLDYWFATHEVDPRVASRRGLRWAELSGLLDGLSARRRLLLMDTCHSGEVDREAGVVARSAGVVVTRQYRGLSLVSHAGLSASFELVRELFTDLRDQTGAAVISAARGSELAQEAGEWNNGAFTFSLVEALRDARADADADGVVRVSELRDYVSRRVPELTSGAQQPTARQQNIDLDFVVGAR